MTQRRRSKRFRNKSSPQIDSSPKKQRNQLANSAEIVEIVEQSDQDSQDNSSVTGSSATVSSAVSSATNRLTMASADSLMDNSSMDSSESAISGTSQLVQSTPNIEQSPRYMNLPSQMSTPPVPPPFIHQPPLMDANIYMQPGTNMNMNPHHQQMIQLSNQMPNIPQSNRLPDEDVVRVAS